MRAGDDLLSGVTDRGVRAHGSAVKDWVRHGA
jgi:hypothetical protein